MSLTVHHRLRRSFTSVLTLCSSEGQECIAMANLDITITMFKCVFN